MTALQIWALTLGSAIILIMLLVAIYASFIHQGQTMPTVAIFFFRVILALAAGALAGCITGFFEVRGTMGKMTLAAGGGLGVFFIVYMLNPPALIETKIGKTKLKAVKRKVISKEKGDKTQ